MTAPMPSWAATISAIRDHVAHGIHDRRGGRTHHDPHDDLAARRPHGEGGFHERFLDGLGVVEDERHEKEDDPEEQEGELLGPHGEGGFHERLLDGLGVVEDERHEKEDDPEEQEGELLGVRRAEPDQQQRNEGGGRQVARG
jgi:hypothetical protein